MKNILLLISLAGIILITGCKKNPITPINPILPTPIYLVCGYKDLGTNDSTSYKYDVSNRMIEIISTANQLDTKLSYDNNSNLTEVDVFNNNGLTQKNLYSYSANLINQQVISYYNGSVSSISYVVITLNNDKKVIKKDFGSNNIYVDTYD